MGSYSHQCVLTGLPVHEGTRAVIQPACQGNPFGLTLRGVYNDYGQYVYDDSLAARCLMEDNELKAGFDVYPVVIREDVFDRTATRACRPGLPFQLSGIDNQSYLKAKLEDLGFIRQRSHPTCTTYTNTTESAGEVVLTDVSDYSFSHQGSVFHKLRKFLRQHPGLVLGKLEADYAYAKAVRAEAYFLAPRRDPYYPTARAFLPGGNAYFSDTDQDALFVRWLYEGYVPHIVDGSNGLLPNYRDAYAFRMMLGSIRRDLAPMETGAQHPKESEQRRLYKTALGL